MTRLKIRHGTPASVTKKTLLQVLANLTIFVTKIIHVRDGFIVITPNDEEVAAVFMKERAAHLKANNFSPVLPPDLKAKTVNSDEEMYDNKTDEIKGEIQHQNT